MALHVTPRPCSGGRLYPAVLGEALACLLQVRPNLGLLAQMLIKTKSQNFKEFVCSLQVASLATKCGVACCQVTSLLGRLDQRR